MTSTRSCTSTRFVVKIRDGGSVVRKACYLALGVTMEGERDVLGMWFQENEGAKFWMQVLNDLKQRGVQDILICCVDGLKGFPEAIEAIFPQTDGPDVHRAPDPPQPASTCPAGNTTRSSRTSSRSTRRPTPTPPWPRSRRFEEKWGAAALTGRQGLAGRLGVRDPVPGVPRGGPPGDLHDG